MRTTWTSNAQRHPTVVTTPTAPLADDERLTDYIFASWDRYNAIRAWMCENGRDDGYPPCDVPGCPKLRDEGNPGA